MVPQGSGPKQGPSICVQGEEHPERDANRAFINGKKSLFSAGGLTLGLCLTKSDTPALSLDCSRTLLGWLKFVFLQNESSSTGDNPELTALA